MSIDIENARQGIAMALLVFNDGGMTEEQQIAWGVLQARTNALIDAVERLTQLVKDAEPVIRANVEQMDADRKTIERLTTENADLRKRKPCGYSPYTDD